MCSPPGEFMAMTRRFRCWPGIRPARDDCGFMYAMIARSADLIRRRQCSSIPATGQASIPTVILRAMRGSSRPMPMRGSTGSMLRVAVQARSPKRLVGATMADAVSFVLADVAAKRGGKPPMVAPLAVEAVKRIDAIFDIEREINGCSIGARLLVRRERVAPLVAELESWMRSERA